MLASSFFRHCPIIGSVFFFLMANRQAFQKRLVLVLCHNLHRIHVRSYWCLFWVCQCSWVCHWLFRGFEPWLIGKLVSTVQIRCTVGIDGGVPDCMLFISSMRRDRMGRKLHHFILLAPSYCLLAYFGFRVEYFSGLHFYECFYNEWFLVSSYVKAFDSCRQDDLH